MYPEAGTHHPTGVEVPKGKDILSAQGMAPETGIHQSLDAELPDEFPEGNSTARGTGRVLLCPSSPETVSQHTPEALLGPDPRGLAVTSALG